MNPIPLLAAALAQSVVSSSVSSPSWWVSEWPADNKFAVRVHFSVWPTGASTQMVYLTHLMSLRAVLRQWRAFGQLEDNHVFGIEVFHWNWGPQLIRRIN